MLRYFYILISIPLCFCYDYIEDYMQFSKRNENSEIENVDREVSKVVQFNVASFLKNTATEKSQNYEPFAYRRTKNEYYYESPLNENIKKRDENTNYLNIDDPGETDGEPSHTNGEVRFDSYSQLFGKSPVNSHKSEVELVPNRENKVNKEKSELIDRDLIQNPEKKCAFKDMKVPFFSRKPSTTSKRQKRKLVCANCTKKYEKDVSKSDKNSKIKQLSLKVKKAYGNLCPKCIRELLMRHKKESKKESQIHSSREFYANVVTAQESWQNDKRAINTFEDYYYSNNGRLKRDENQERDRQLKELAEVEKKVDHVQVTTPKFNIVPMKIIEP